MIHVLSAIAIFIVVYNANSMTPDHIMNARKSQLSG